ncbi:MAG TPA: hypothetical protein VNZ86_01150 [Bacteroidia bacterium]|jgi:hypothetical protein|nr:hypothetical protein [Bacteroidia bacterium]
MQKIVLLILLALPFFYTPLLQAQTVSDSTHADIKADPALFALLEKRKAIGIKNLKGYRVKIHFGAEKGKANEIKAKFCQKYPDVPAYLDYDTPNFSITVGNYRSRLDAYRIYKLIQPDFPNAFIVEMKIDYPDLTVHKEEAPKDK